MVLKKRLKSTRQKQNELKSGTPNGKMFDTSMTNWVLTCDRSVLDPSICLDRDYRINVVTVYAYFICVLS